MHWREFHDTMAQRRAQACRGLPVMGPLPTPIKMNRSVDILINHFFDDCLEGGDVFLPPPLPFRDPVNPDDSWVTWALEFYADNQSEAVQRARDESGHQNTSLGQALPAGGGARGRWHQGPHRVPTGDSSSEEDDSNVPTVSTGPVDRSHLLRAASSRLASVAAESPPSADNDSDWSP